MPARAGVAAGVRRHHRRRHGPVHRRGAAGQQRGRLRRGGIGNSVIMGAKLARAGQIIGVDIAANKLDWAREFGATDVVDATQTDPVERIKELTGGHGVDYSFEAVGTPATLLQALWSRDLAGTCILISVPDPAMIVELPMLQFFGLGSVLRVSWYGDCLPSRDFPLLANYYLNLKRRCDGHIADCRAERTS